MAGTISNLVYGALDFTNMEQKNSLENQHILDLNSSSITDELKQLNFSDVDSHITTNSSLDDVSPPDNALPGTLQELSDGATKGMIFTLKGDESMKKKRIFDALTSQQVDIVLTAHPTEVNRRFIA